MIVVFSRRLEECVVSLSQDHCIQDSPIQRYQHDDDSEPATRTSLKLLATLLKIEIHYLAKRVEPLHKCATILSCLSERCLHFLF